MLRSDERWVVAAICMKGKVLSVKQGFLFTDESNPSVVSNIHSVVAVGCGDSHTVALTHEGRVFSCGSDSFGQLGCGRPSASQNSMRCITEMLGSHVTRIACGRLIFSTFVALFPFHFVELHFF